MQTDAEIPCSTCVMWNQKRKSLSCNPNICGKLAKWLRRQGKSDAKTIHEKIVQYVV